MDIRTVHVSTSASTQLIAFASWRTRVPACRDFWCSALWVAAPALGLPLCWWSISPPNMKSSKLEFSVYHILPRQWWSHTTPSSPPTPHWSTLTVLSWWITRLSMISVANHTHKRMPYYLTAQDEGWLSVQGWQFSQRPLTVYKGERGDKLLSGVMAWCLVLAQYAPVVRGGSSTLNLIESSWTSSSHKY